MTYRLGVSGWDKAGLPLASMGYIGDSSGTTPTYFGVMKRWNGHAWERVKLRTYVSGAWEHKPLLLWAAGAWKLIDTD